MTRVVGVELENLAIPMLEHLLHGAKDRLGQVEKDEIPFTPRLSHPPLRWSLYI